MIRVFAPSDKDFSSNGDYILHPTRAKVHKEDNGDYYLDLVTGIECSDYMVEGNIVVVDTPQGKQGFRITNPQKTNSKITVKAWHLYYDSEDYVISDAYVVEKNCNNALVHLNGATSPVSPFTVSSDVSTVDSFRCVRQSLESAIQTVLSRWGGHLVRDNFNIRIQSTIGEDNGVTVEYRKNLREISCEEDWSDVVTQLLPVGKDGILLNEVDSSQNIYLFSDKQYDIPYAKALTFTQTLERENYPSDDAYMSALVEDLRAQGEAYLAVNSFPKVNYTLKANIEELSDVGDIIEVKDKRLGVDLLTSVIAFDYDCILEKYTEIEFGNFRPKLSSLITSVTADATASATASARQELDSSLETVWSAMTDLESQIEEMSDYDTLENKPQIEGVTLEGNKTFEELNLSGITNSQIENIFS